MQQDVFLSHIEAHFKKALPFVVYRKPHQISVKALLQSDNQLHTTTEFTESGFVFAPFKDSEQTILIPLNTSESHSCEIHTRALQSNPETSFLNSEKAKTAHLRLVKKGIDAIKHGVVQKVVLSRCEVLELPEPNIIKLFLGLLKTYPSAFVYCWFHPKIGLWLGATPETLIELQGKRFKTMALAGTQKDDGQQPVIWTEKEQLEQQFVTDYIVGQLADKTSNLHVTEAATSKAGQLLHLRSDISGLLSSDLKSVITALHPTPAVCGLPLREAKAFIQNQESYDREFYTGFLGELNLKTSITRNTNTRNVENNAYSAIKTTSHLFVNLRCVQLKGSTALVYVGGGITKDSKPENEWQETIHKAETMLSVLRV